MEARFFSVYSVFRHYAGIGLGVAWDKGEFCVVLNIGQWVIILGPHYAIEERREL